MTDRTLTLANVGSCLKTISCASESIRELARCGISKSAENLEMAALCDAIDALTERCETHAAAGLKHLNTLHQSPP